MKLRKGIALLLSFAMVLTTANLAAVGEAFAETAASEEATIVENGQCGSKVNWTLDSTGTLTLSGSGSTYSFKYESTNGTIYREVDTDGDGVKERVPNPFSSNNKIKKVIVGEGITSMGNHLFYDCRYLADVKLPETLKTIGSGAFQKCIALEEVTLPESVTEMNTGAFKEDTALKRMVIPKGVTEISKELFNECTALEEVVIPESVTAIGGRAFRKCVSLKAIDFPDNLKELATHTLAYCAALTEVEIPKGVTSIGDYCFYDCDGLTELKIPDAVQFIDASCFEGCGNLETVNIPDGITELSEQVFYKCKSLKTVQIPDSVTSIGAYAFSQCDALETIELPASVQKLGSHAFYEDNILREVQIPEGVTAIPKNCFSYCEALETVVIPKSVTSIEANAFRACIGLKKVEIPEGVESIGKEAFRECRYIEEMTLPSTLKELGSFALFNCHQLKEIDLPDGLTTLGEQALYGLSNITEVTVPKGITEIGQNTFRGCKKLEHIIFLGDVTSIGSYALADCYMLLAVNLPQTLVSLGEGAFEGCTVLKGITLPAGVTKVEKNTFQNCNSLQTVSLAEGTTEIGGNAFYGCSQMKVLTIPKNVSTLGTNALPANVKIRCYKDSPAETFAKGNGRRYAYVGGAEEDNLFKGVIESETTQAEWSVDRDSEKMIITWNGTMPNYTASTQPWKDVRDYIKSVEVFGNVGKLGPYTFSKCSYLEEVAVYNRNCNLSALELPKTVRVIGFSGSTAEAYAKENGNAFVSMDAKHTHRYGEGTEIKGSTCSVAGEALYICEICFYEKYEPQPLLQHQNKTEMKPADFDRQGEYKVFCQDCGKLQESREIPKIKEVKLSASSKVYNGKVQKPEIVVTDEMGTVLQEDTDYVIQWKTTCKTVGRHKVTVTFTGDYAGSRELDFTIVPKKTASAKAVLYGYDDVKFSWSKVSGASGYLVYYKKDSGAWSKAVSVTSTSYKKANLSDGVKYTFKVVPYYKEKNAAKKYYDANQYKSATVYTLKKIAGVKLSKSGTKVKVSWTNINGETGYQISKMTKKSATQKKPFAVQSASAKSKLVTATKGKTYYYKVRAYKTVNGKKIFGPWSDAKAYKRK